MKYSIRNIAKTEINAVAEFSTDNFVYDHYYDILSPNESKKRVLLLEIFNKSINICVEKGIAKVVMNDNTIVAILLAFDYYKIKNNYHDDYLHFFYNKDNEKSSERPTEKIFNIDKSLINDSKECLYLLAIAVAPAYRRQKVATSLITSVINAYPQYDIVSDVSNEDSLNIYRKLHFNILNCEKNCWNIKKLRFDEETSNACKDCILNENSDALLGVPFSYIQYLNDYIIVEKIIMNDMSIASNMPILISDMGSGCEIVIVKLPFSELLKFQRRIGLINVIEIIKIIKNMKFIYYLQASSGEKIFHKYSADIYKNKKIEWNIVPDVFTSIPISIRDKNLIETESKKHNDYIINRLLTSMKFRTDYESGVPTDNIKNESFKTRLKRFYLGNLNVQILCENEISFDGSKCECILGESVKIGIIISLDTNSNIGVLHLVAFSCGIVISQYLDSISRNQLTIIKDGEKINLYEYIEKTWNVQKVGSPKNFLTIFDKREAIPNELIASLLFCETHYDDGESIGTVVDAEIKKTVDNPNGESQYNYASIYIYSNILLQISDKLNGSISERIIKESITLFYIELVAFEEAAIGYANNKIVRFLTTIDKQSPSNTLKEINEMLEKYAKTMEFWDIQMNYPSSKKSVDGIRKGFKTEKLLERYKRSQQIIEQIYDSRSDLIDKVESSILTAVGAILTTISIINIVIEPTKHLLFVIASLLVASLLFAKSKLFKRALSKNKKR